MKSTTTHAWVIIAFLCMSHGVCLATPYLRWQISSTNSTSALRDQNGTALASSQTSAILGSFLQLLYVGNNGVIDPASGLYDDAHGGDDQVVAWGFVGFGTKGQSVNGYFLSGTNKQVNVSGFVAGTDQFYFRSWNAPVNSTNAYNAGAAPIGTNGTATYYGDGPTHILASDAVADTWSLTNGFMTTIAAPAPVPEPGTLALLGVGLGLIAFRRRRV